MVKTAAEAMQRAASLVPLPGLLDELGVSLEAVLKDTDVSPGELQPDSFIRYAAYLAILDNAARITGREDFGLLLGRRQTLAALGPLGLVMQCAASLGEALNEFVAFQIGNSTGSTVYLMRADRDIILGYGVYDPAIHVSPQIHDMVVATGCALISELTHGVVKPEEILSSRDTPRDLTPYRTLARCPVRFGQGQTGLVLATATMELPLPEAERISIHPALAEMAPAMAAARQDTKGLVRHVLRYLLLSGVSGMDEVAARLGIHPRSLRRRLRSQGTTFEAIRDELRFAVARELLELGALNVTDIAMTLDFASLSSFVHAFHRWSGMSPTAWRNSAARRAE